MTGNPKIDTAVFVILMVLFAVSEALGNSSRFRANGVVQLIAHFVKAGSKGVLTAYPASGLVQHIVDKTEPCIEKAIESALGSTGCDPNPSPTATTSGSTDYLVGSGYEKLTAGHK